MKTAITLIAAILALVTVTTFAQTEEGLFVTVKYSPKMNRFETWASTIKDRISHNNTDEADLPIISQTYYAEFVDVSYENESSIESWMTSPFEEVNFEENLYMEPWMSTPFQEEKLQEELPLESWMTTPFETDELIKMENWMTSALWK
ncbi:MAG: hypothetical protein GY790_21040 [Bacteroidetes bacterium]|nr:hypothetical protein [Bacteroidota bacterium]